MSAWSRSESNRFHKVATHGPKISDGLGEKWKPPDALKTSCPWLAQVCVCVSVCVCVCVCVCARARALSHVRFFGTLWAIAHQASLSMGFFSWSRLLFPLPGDLPNIGIEPVTPVSPALHTNAFPIELSGRSSSLISAVSLLSDVYSAQWEPTAHPPLEKVRTHWTCCHQVTGWSSWETELY